MAMKVPCIVSSLANNAIGATIDKEIIEANSPAEFAAAWSLLAGSKMKYDSICGNAFQFVKKKFDWKYQDEKLEKIILS